MNEQPLDPQQLPPQPAPQAQPEQQFYQPATQTVGGQPSAYAGYALTASDPAPTMTQDQQVTDVAADIDWEASEYIHHDKGALWIIGLVVVTLVFVGFAVWLQIWTFAALVVLMAVTMGIFAFRPPRVLHYSLSDKGLQIDNRFYSFADFRAFGVLGEGAFYTVMLIPAKRFMPAISVFFAEQDGERIVDILGKRLPMEQLQLDLVDKLMRRLRF
jgi:hypothetical protein